MSSGTLAAGEMPGQQDDGIPFGVRLQQLAEQRADEPALDTLAPDGTVRSLTFAQLDAQANQWGRALAAAGAQTGSLVALAIPKTAEPTMHRLRSVFLMVASTPLLSFEING